jgi:opacity protein-like surface antigen
MKMFAGTSRLIVLSLAGFAASGPAHAGNFFASVHAGPRYLLDADLSRDEHGGPLEVGRLHFDNFGGTASVSGGYEWDNGLALESEFAYRRNGLKKDVFFGESTKLDGTLSSYTLLLNGYYFLRNESSFTPYIGGGVGVSLLDLDAQREGEATFHGYDTDSQFAYQGIAGVQYEFTPHWSLGVEYRFFGTQDPSFIDSVSGTRVWTETVYHAHEILFGATFTFD